VRGGAPLLTSWLVQYRIRPDPRCRGSTIVRRGPHALSPSQENFGLLPISALSRGTESAHASWLRNNAALRNPLLRCSDHARNTVAKLSR
jgi:hypothetical protein